MEMKIKIDNNAPEPLYLQIEKQLRMLIQQPEYKKGKKLPKEADIAEELGISRNTVRQAINNLVNDGLLLRKKRFGTVVQNMIISSKGQNWQSFSQEMKALGITPKNYELHIYREKPQQKICAFFGIGNETKVLKLERLRGNGQQPFVYFISYFNPSIGMTGNEDFSQPLYSILETEYGIVVKTSKEVIKAQPADEFFAAKLEIKTGAPILVRERAVFDSKGKPVEWNVGYYRADCFAYVLEFDR